jgi:hypothetical protein
VLTQRSLRRSLVVVKIEAVNFGIAAAKECQQ